VVEMGPDRKRLVVLVRPAEAKERREGPAHGGEDAAFSFPPMAVRAKTSQGTMKGGGRKMKAQGRTRGKKTRPRAQQTADEKH